MLTNKLVDFLENILVKLIRHINMLNTLNLQLEDSGSVYFDIDFSENLTASETSSPISSLVVFSTAFSGISKTNGERCTMRTFHTIVNMKILLPRLFQICFREQINKEIKVIVIESDNCKSKYKSAKHVLENQTHLR